MLKPRVLFLCHRVPYPPDKGDKIRSYQWLLALSSRCRVSLAAFVDSPDDLRHEEYLRSLCEDVLLVPLRPGWARLRGLTALLSDTPITQRYFFHPAIEEWVGSWQANREPGCVLVYSSAMAQYVVAGDVAGRRRIVDFVDVDSEKWRQYALAHTGIQRWLYRREARCLLAYDAKIARACEAALFVSEAEAELFSAKTGVLAVESIVNGVDSDYFSTDEMRVSPFAAGGPTAVFTGAMDYWANADAVAWFAGEIWPAVVAEFPGARFYIVGARPTRAVSSLAGSNVFVTGRVDDVRPYLQFASAVVAPMRVARGVQNKVLEGMAMARPVVATEAGREGLNARSEKEIVVADDPAEFAHGVISVFRGRYPSLGRDARAYVVREHGWERKRGRLLRLLEGLRETEPELDP